MSISDPRTLYPGDAAERTQWVETQLTALWQSRMDYARYHTLGVQVGRGAGETACKHVIQARSKQIGMRWGVRNARTMAKLRARLKSGRWNETLALCPKPARAYHRRSA